ncbi:hypothetical protein HOLleu_09056 [Holothuria leucospilota]|uniref:Uncharacterized protein n=1 Tax=Holothuria leucospilota TaxID=206669 RepID=A0A9Q1CJN3_HOLLE|nr:hypothetical protein HOLleu_09056 [Holothuria leucospilota]
MFIYVRFGRDETALCNPQCKVINLLDHLQTRTQVQGSVVLLDLADNTGLIKDLQSHRDEDADKYLHHLQTYILIGKKLPQSEFNDEASSRCDSARDIDSLRGDTPHSLTPREDIITIKSKSPLVIDSKPKRREESILNDYIVLLENLEEIFPYFRLRLSEDGRSRRSRIRGIQQAGRLVMHQKKTKAKRTKTKSGE